MLKKQWHFDRSTIIFLSSKVKCCCLAFPSSKIRKKVSLEGIFHLGVEEEKFSQSFTLKFLSIFEHISDSINPKTPIRVSLERLFPPAELEYKWPQILVMQPAANGLITLLTLLIKYATRINYQWYKSFILFINQQFDTP